jgi:hypothetical protein
MNTRARAHLYRDRSGLSRAIAIVACVAVSTLVVSAEIPGVLGRASLANSELDFELQASAVAPDGQALWFVTTARPKGQVRGDGSLVLATVDARNQLTQSALVLGPPVAAADQLNPGAPRQLVEGMTFDAHGDLLIAVGRGRAPAAIVKVPTATRRADAARPLQLSTADFDLHELVRLTDGRVLAFGIVEDKLFAAELADNGRVAWQKTLPVPTGVVEMAAPTSDGGAVVLARRGQDTPPGEVWVGKLSPKGDVERAITFPGRRGSVAALREGGYALVTSLPGARGFDVMLRVLDRDMHERSSTRLATDQVNPGFSVVAAPREGFIVAGAKDRGLWASQIAADGRSLWTEARTPAPPEAEMVFNVQLRAAGDTLFLPYTAFTLQGREQRQSIRVVKFQVK